MKLKSLQQGSPWATTVGFSSWNHHGMEPSCLSFPSAKRKPKITLQRKWSLPRAKFCLYQTQPPSLYHLSSPKTTQNKCLGLRNTPTPWVFHAVSRRHQEMKSQTQMRIWGSPGTDKGKHSPIPWPETLGKHLSNSVWKEDSGECRRSQELR